MTWVDLVVLGVLARVRPVRLHARPGARGIGPRRLGWRHFRRRLGAAARQAAIPGVAGHFALDRSGCLRGRVHHQPDRAAAARPLDQCAGAGFADRRPRPNVGAGIRPGQGCGADHHCLYPWRAGAACGPWPKAVLEARSIHFAYRGASWTVEHMPTTSFFHPPPVYPPPPGRQTTADALLHATPQGRAVGR